MQRLIIELFLKRAGRGPAGVDPRAFDWKPQTYERTLPGGGVRQAELNWAGGIRAALEELSKPGGTRQSEARLGEALSVFVKELGFDVGQWQAALDEGKQVHVVLRFSAAELYALPWELVRVGGRDLGNTAGVDLRYLMPEAAGKTARQRTDGQVLLAWSAAGGPVPADDHLAALGDALTAGGLPKPERLPGASHESLAAALRRATEDRRPVTILHLLAHGGLVEGHVGLVLDPDDDSENSLTDGRTLARLLGGYRDSLRLVVLCACRSADPGALDGYLGSLAQELSEAGIESVVASRAPLTTRASVILARSLFTALAAADPPVSLETALALAREDLLHANHASDALSIQRYARPTPQGSYDTRPLWFRPYRGLQAFGPEHRRFFFGRDPEIAELLAEFEALLVRGKARMQVVEGASGSGKSSLVMAGLVPALLEQGNWAWLRMVPGANPLAALEFALVKASAIPLDQRILLVVDQLEELFTYAHPRELLNDFGERLWQIANEDDGRTSVVCTMRTDFRGRCGEVLLQRVRKLDDGRIEGRFLDSLFNDGQHDVYVPQMPPERLVEVVEAPARSVGLQVEAGLAQRIAEQVGDEPGALPLLQFTMDKVWEQQHERGDATLRQADYDALGGAIGALQIRAEALLSGWDEERLRVAQRLLVRLVSSDGAAARATRRRTPLDQLRPAATEPFDAVLAELVDERLLVRSRGPDGGAQVEVAHEALIRSWSRLRKWLDADRGMVEAVARVDEWAGEWRADRLGLLSGNQLGFARQVRDTWGEAELSVDAREHLTQSEAKARRRLRQWLMAAALLTVAVAVIVVVIAGKNVELERTNFALVRQGEQLEDKEQRLSNELHAKQKLRATSARQRLLADAAAVGETAPQLSLLLAMEVYEQTPKPDRRLTTELGQVLLDGVARSGGHPLRGHASALRGAAIDAAGDTAVTWASTPPSLVWDLRELPPRSRSFSADSALVHASLARNGTELISLDEAGRVRVWSLEPDRVELEDQLIELGSSLGSWFDDDLVLTHGPNDDVLVAADRVWRRVDGRWREHARHDHIHDVAFARGEQRVVIATGSGVIIEDLDLGARRVSSIEPGDTATESRARVSASADGQWVLSAQAGEIALWRPDDEDPQVGDPVAAESADVRLLGFATDPATAIAVTDEGVIYRWALNRRAALSQSSHVALPEGMSSALYFERAHVEWAALLELGLFTSGSQATIRDHGNSPRVRSLDLGDSFVRSSVSHGDQLFAGLQDGSIVSWDLADPDPNWTRERRRGHDRYVNGLWISADGERMISAAIVTPNGYTGYEVDRPEARLWTPGRDGEVPQQLRVAQLGSWLRALDWSPDGRYVALHEFWGLWSKAGTLRLLPVEPSAEVIELPEQVTSFALGRNFLATLHGAGSEQGDARIHVVDTSERRGPPRSLEADFSVDQVDVVDDRWLVAHHIELQGPRVELWELASDSLDRVELPSQSRALAFAPDAVRACVITDETVQIWSFAGPPTRVGEPLQLDGGVPVAVGIVGEQCVALVERPGESPGEHASLAIIELDDAAAGAGFELESDLGWPVDLHAAGDAVLLATDNQCMVVGLDGATRVSRRDCDSAVVAADGSRLVATRNDRHVPFELSDWRRGAQIEVAEIADDIHCDPLLSPDGSMLITAGREGIRIHDLARSGDAQIVVLPSDSGSAWFGCPALSPDGHQLAVNTMDGAVVWPLELERLAEAARQTAGRELTSWELDRYAIDPFAQLRWPLSVIVPRLARLL